MEPSPEITAAGTLLCRQCGYNVAGLPRHICPECGTPFDPKGLVFHWKMRDVATLIVRTVALVSLVKAVPSFEYFFIWVLSLGSHLNSAAGMWRPELASVLVPVAHVALAAVLWRVAKPLGLLMVPRDPDQPVTLGWSPRDVQVIVFSAIGLIVCVWAVPAIWNSAAMLIYYHYANPQSAYVDAANIARGWFGLVGNILLLLCGAGVFAGARRISDLWHYLRTAGAGRGAGAGATP